MVENQFQTKISILWSDDGTEFYNDCLGAARERYFTSINL